MMYSNRDVKATLGFAMLHWVSVLRYHFFQYAPIQAGVFTLLSSQGGAPYHYDSLPITPESSCAEYDRLSTFGACDAIVEVEGCSSKNRRTFAIGSDVTPQKILSCLSPRSSKSRDYHRIRSRYPYWPGRRPGAYVPFELPIRAIGAYGLRGDIEMALLYKHPTVTNSNAASWYITQLSKVLRLFSAGVL
jgi:hypothetical protein